MLTIPTCLYLSVPLLLLCGHLVIGSGWGKAVLGADSLCLSRAWWSRTGPASHQRSVAASTSAIRKALRSWKLETESGWVARSGE